MRSLIKISVILSILFLLLTSIGLAAPTVADVQPPNGSLQPVSATVSATFSEPMDANTIAPGSLTLWRVGLKAIAAGMQHTLALRDNGTVVGWGRTDFGQCTVPAGLTGVVAVDASKYHTVALKNDGTVVAWGYGGYGQTSVPAGLSGVTAIAAGAYHSVALKNDGTVVAWGENGIGQCTVPAGLTGVVDIAAGAGHTLALKEDGTVVAWGDNYYGQGTVPEGLSGVKKIDTRGNHNLALKENGTVVAWGYNDYGISTVPLELSDVIAISAGYAHSLALKSDGTVVAWGYNSYGQITVPENLSGVAAIAAGGSQSVVIKADGTIVGWGDNSYGQASVPESLSGISAVAAGNFQTLALKGDKLIAWGYNGQNQSWIPAGLSGIAAFAGGGSHNVVLKNDGTVIAWGSNSSGQLSIPAGLSGVTAVAAGGVHTVALKNDGIVTWGGNGQGQCTVPAGLSGITAISAGGSHTVALGGDGTVVAWGDNGSGQTTVPAGLSNVVAIAAGGNHTATLKADGTVVAWGSNGSGQTTVPAGLSQVIAIAAGMSHTVALKEDGTVVVWGDAGLVPVGLNGVAAIAAGYRQTVALKRDGSVIHWGGLVFNNAVPMPVSPYDMSVAGTVNYDEVTKTAVFTPSASLQPASIYFATVNTGARNTEGLPFVSDFRWSFTTPKVPAIVTFYSLNQIYDGTPKSVTMITDPPGLTVDITYNSSATVPTNAGSYAVVATIKDPYYQGSVSDTLVIAKASAQFNFVGLDQTYDGTPRVVTATTMPVGLAFELTYDGSSTAPINVGDGTYDIVANVNDTNYEGSANSTLNVAKATATVTLSGLDQTYTGAPKVVTATTDPAGLNFDMTYDDSSTAPTNVGDGTYDVVATINDPNHAGSVNGTLNVAKANATITLIGLNQTYDGTPKVVTATTNPTGLTVDILYDFNATNADTYPVSTIVTEANYQGSITGDLFISKANQTISFPCPITARKQDVVTLSASTSSGLPVTLKVVNGPGVINGSTLTFTAKGPVVVTASQAGNNNYNAAADVSGTVLVQ